MKLLADENIPLASFTYLAQIGFDIIHIGVEFPSISDKEVIDLAIQQDRIILTFDRDYGALVFRNGFKPPGVIYLRLSDYAPSYPGKFIYSLIEQRTYRFEGNFTVASEENVRQRKIG